MRLNLFTSLISTSSLLALLCVASCNGDTAPGDTDDTTDSETGDSATSDASTSGGVCAPGMSVACACPSGETGAQVCEPDGAGYGPCVCGGDGDGDG
ncbi:MAG: hypothetical protein KC468_31440, partial [Myxococcales bacterium]|nr:hypothetical protein [Myxococcales bacterium]